MKSTRPWLHRLSDLWDNGLVLDASLPQKMLDLGLHPLTWVPITLTWTPPDLSRRSIASRGVTEVPLGWVISSEPASADVWFERMSHEEREMFLSVTTRDGLNAMEFALRRQDSGLIRQLSTWAKQLNQKPLSGRAALVSHLRQGASLSRWHDDQRDRDAWAALMETQPEEFGQSSLEDRIELFQEIVRSGRPGFMQAVLASPAFWAPLTIDHLANVQTIWSEHVDLLQKIETHPWPWGWDLLLSRKPVDMLKALLDAGVMPPMTLTTSDESDDSSIKSHPSIRHLKRLFLQRLEEDYQDPCAVFSNALHKSQDAAVGMDLLMAHPECKILLERHALKALSVATENEVSRPLGTSFRRL